MAGQDSINWQSENQSLELQKVQEIDTTFSGLDSILSLDLSLDGSTLVAADGEYAHFCDTRTGKILLTSADLAITCAVYGPDGLVVATGDESGTIILWTPEQRQRLWREFTSEERKWMGSFWEKERQQGLLTNRPHTDLVMGLQYSPSGQLLASASADGTLNLWDLVSNTQRTILSPEREAFEAAVKIGTEADEGLVRGPFSSLAFSPDGKFIAGSSYDERENANGEIVTVGSVSLWDVADGSIYATLVSNTYHYGISYSSDGSMVAGVGSDGMIRIWSTLSGELITTLAHSGAEILGIDFRSGARVLAAGDNQGTLTVWDIHREKPLATVSERGGPILAVRFSHDGRLLAYGTSDGRIVLWRIDRGLHHRKQPPI